MAWGFRRSLRIAGPLRLNFSKSGLGLSLGVPGLHVGASPRGRYLRAGIPGTGIYYRKSLKGPKPTQTRAPRRQQNETPWIQALHALLAGDAERCLELLKEVEGRGPAIHLEVDDDVVVTLHPDPCGIAVMRAEALQRLGRLEDALQTVRNAADGGCDVARVVVIELQDALGLKPDATGGYPALDPKQESDRE
jgi:hypothetical protein